MAKTVTIAWHLLFANPAFRLGWVHSRAGAPPDPTVGDIEPSYQLGRLMAIEAENLKLPDVAPYFSLAMRQVIDTCPAMVNEFAKSTIRFYAELEAKQKAGVPVNVGGMER